jgi:hypothetical protein
MHSGIMQPKLDSARGEVKESIVNNNVKSLAQLAFVISPPGTAPNNDAIKEFFGRQTGWYDIVGTHVGGNKHKN